MLQFLPRSLPDANVIVGLDAPDDAGVYRLTPDLALVQTVAFFTPIVDDAYAFGAIAAANALSDVYAMGGKPITALNLVGYPITRQPKAVLADILRGGADKVREAGAVILGGHSIDDTEPKYGLAVTGTIHPDRIIAKAGARPGDVLVLTKPIGIGVVTTAHKRGLVPDDEMQQAIAVMAALNNAIEDLASFDIRGGTDITGFGLLGHASEIARESGVGLRIYMSQVPVLPFAWQYAEQGIFPGGSNSNLRWLEPLVDYDPGVSEVQRRMLCDAVTSGGLLLCVPAAQAQAVVDVLRRRGTPAAAVIGEAVPDHPGRITTLP